jgi:hypothetical protein
MRATKIKFDTFGNKPKKPYLCRLATSCVAGQQQNLIFSQRLQNFISAFGNWQGCLSAPYFLDLLVFALVYKCDEKGHNVLELPDGELWHLNMKVIKIKFKRLTSCVKNESTFGVLSGN